jgi:ABC-type amino acid transport substrate-binding protein
MSVKQFTLAAALLSLAACQSAPATETAATQAPAATATPAALAGKTYGAAVTADGARPLSELKQVLGTQDSARVKLVGKADAVCQAKGCWLTMKTPEGQEMRVRFKDYAFFVPKDISGKTIVINGWAHREVVPASDLQHYAKDAGKSEKEVAAITQPEVQLNFEADGVLVADKTL